MARKPPADYEVGFGKPPKATRFKPGQSGNPKGRPRKRKSMLISLDERGDKKVWATDNGTRRKVTVREAFADQIWADGFRGDRQARAYLLRVIPELELAKVEAEAKKAVKTAKPHMNLLSRLKPETLHEIREQLKIESEEQAKKRAGSTSSVDNDDTNDDADNTSDDVE